MPVRRSCGPDRGQAIDRYYIGRFLAGHSDDIRGTVLEIGEDRCAVRFGEGRVAQSDILHAVPGNPRATWVGDLATGEGIPEGLYGCFIAVQTYQFIYDLVGAARHSYAALKPAGVLPATVTGISQISRYDMDRWGEFWRFTTESARRLFEGPFGQENVQVCAHGNALVACSFLRGLALHEVDLAALKEDDQNYPVILTIQASRLEPAREDHSCAA